MTISGMSNHTSNNQSNGPSMRPGRPEILNGIRNFLNGSSYREVIESSSTYNNNIVHERKLRLPYLDSQTGVAQSDCFLWFNRADRRPGTESGQLYTYPAKRWKKKRRQYLMNDSYLTRGRQPLSHSLESSSATFDHDSNSNLSSDGLQGVPGVTKNEPGMNPNSEGTNGNSTSKFGFHRDDSKDSWYDYEDGSDLPDAGELDEESDFDDYDEYTTSRRKKKTKEKTPRRKRAEYSDAEKPFACEVCGARYKTRPGLSYHYTHSHQVENPELLVQGSGVSGDGQEGGGTPFTPPRQPLPTPPHLSGPGVCNQGQGQPSPGAPAVVGTNLAGCRGSPLPSSVSNAGATTGTESPNTTTSSASSQDGFAGNRPAGKGTVAPPQDYCDFCLGDTAENKKTKSAESLVSCSDCGRSAHPTCLQFTPNMIASVKKYRWQCIECKSCGLCGTSDNDVSDRSKQLCSRSRLCSRSSIVF